jgi:hypothetical protein
MLTTTSGCRWRPTWGRCARSSWSIRRARASPAVAGGPRHHLRPAPV